MKDKKEKCARTNRLLIVKFLPAKYLLCGICAENRFNLVLPLLICVSTSAASLFAMYLPKMVLDAVESGIKTRQFFFRVGIACALLACASLAAMVLRNELSLVSQSFLYTKLTTRWERGMLRMDYGAFVSGRGKILAEKARNAISSPNWGVVKFLPGLSAVLEAFVGLLICCGIVGSLHPAVVIFLLLLFAVQLWFSTRMQKGKQQLKEERAAVDRRLNYLAWGMRGRKEGKDIRLYSFGTLLSRIVRQTVKAKQEVEGKVEKLQFYDMVFAAFLLLLRDGTAYFYLIWQFFHSGMTLGDFTFYFAAVTGVGTGLLQLAQAVSDFLETQRYAEDFFEFIQFSVELEKKAPSNSLITQDNPAGQTHWKFPQNENWLKIGGREKISFVFENVSFSYFTEQDGIKQEIPVIKNLNLTIHAGESIAIVGVNGAGKSTFVKLLCGLFVPCGGRILVNGVDSRLFCREEYFGLFSAVFQKSGFLPVSIAENIMLNVKRKKLGKGCDKDLRFRQQDDFDDNVPKEEEGEDRKAMWECIRLAGLEEKVKSLPQGVDTCLVKRIAHDGTELSGGQEQKLLLARALYKDAPVLILDEPTAALDPVAEHKIYQDYRRMTKGRTSVFISHRLASTRFCDRILLFSEGKILEGGTHEELITLGGQYKEMFEVQSRYYKEERVEREHSSSNLERTVRENEREKE